MASLQIETTGVYHIVFRFQGRRFKRSLETKIETVALARREEVDETIQLLKSRRIAVPENVPAEAFILAGGRVDAIKPEKGKAATDVSPASLTLQGLFDQFFDSLPDENLEANTLRTMHTHKAHFLRLIKPRFPAEKLTGHELQKYVNARSKEHTQYPCRSGSDSRRKVSATTIKKEIATLGTVWRWAANIPILEGNFPSRGLRFPKTEDKPSFQTFAEITQQIQAQSLTAAMAAELWECLYLQKDEIDDLLSGVQARDDLPIYIYPMIAAAAYTGARRSELLRVQVVDVNFANQMLTLREKKRVRGRRSVRQVPMSSKLVAILKEHIAIHPGCTSLFCTEDAKTITTNMAQNAFRFALSKSKWSAVRGWHTLRHSFISNLACDAIDQRLIDEFVGHTTEEMRRRYRHLFPEVKRSAILQVFG